MPTALPARATCGVCRRPAVTALVIGSSTLPVCRADAQRLIDGEFVYAPHSALRAQGSLLADGPVAYPLRAVQ